jgi:transcriptional regulator with XRE-family HTH domain
MSESRADDRQPTSHPRERLWRELVGEQLREIRQDRGETLRTVAGRADVSPQYLSEIERGSKEPSSEILAAIGGSLDTSLLDLTTAVAQRLTASTSRGAFALAA